MSWGPEKMLIRCSKESQHPAEWTPGLRLSIRRQERHNVDGHKFGGQNITVYVRSLAPSHTQTLSNPFQTLAIKWEVNIFVKKSTCVCYSLRQYVSCVTMYMRKQWYYIHLDMFKFTHMRINTKVQELEHAQTNWWRYLRAQTPPPHIYIYTYIYKHTFLSIINKYMYLNTPKYIDVYVCINTYIYIYIYIYSPTPVLPLASIASLFVDELRSRRPFERMYVNNSNCDS